MLSAVVVVVVVVASVVSDAGVNGVANAAVEERNELVVVDSNLGGVVEKAKVKKGSSLDSEEEVEEGCLCDNSN